MEWSSHSGPRPFCTPLWDVQIIHCYRLDPPCFCLFVFVLVASGLVVRDYLAPLEEIMLGVKDYLAPLADFMLGVGDYLAPHVEFMLVVENDQALGSNGVLIAITFIPVWIQISLYPFTYIKITPFNKMITIASPHYYYFNYFYLICQHINSILVITFKSWLQQSSLQNFNLSYYSYNVIILILGLF